MSVEQRLAETVRTEGHRILATLVRTVGDLQVAEDAVQDAAIAALRTWPRTGVPQDPRAWLAVTARNKALDALRREAARPAKQMWAGVGAALTSPDPAEEAMNIIQPDSVVRDDLLRLVFTCCHPALAREAQVALALRTLAGLDVAAIARAFLIPEATMAKRLTRARQKITQARIPYRVPTDTELPERLGSVLAVVHLIATEAHAPSSGDVLVRVDLGSEALRLCRLLVDLMPGEPELISLLALLLFTHARHTTRTDPAGNPVLLAAQDRSRWDKAAITEASTCLAEAVRRSGGVAGPYQLQAHLAACHATAPAWADTDWDRIIDLYDLLLTLAPNPAVALNRAVAVAERDGPTAALAALADIDAMSHSHLWHAARADALHQLGQDEQAQHALTAAIELAPTEPERRLLARRLADIDQTNVS